MNKYLIGPVFSRRIGRSLGVDLLKGECTFLCPYCEVRVRHVKNLRLFPFRQTPRLLEEYETFCRSHSPRDLDSVTFSGTGEPTLIANLGEILRAFKKIGSYPITVITNGSLLWMPEVRRNLAEADCVIPSLDAVTPPAWRRVNRPHPEMTLEKYLEGTKTFCDEYAGKILMEVILVDRVNDAPPDIDALGRFLGTLRLNCVQVGTVDRPPSKSRVRPVPLGRLKMLARRIARESGRRVEIITRGKRIPVSRTRAVRPAERPGRILDSVRLRPQTRAELSKLLAVPHHTLDRVIAGLECAGRIARVRFGRRVFIQAVPSEPTTRS